MTLTPLEKNRQFALVALMAAVTAALGWVPKIDLAFGVPITLQTLGVMLAGCLLGARLGFLSMLLFLLAVALGLPLMSGGRGGLGVFQTPAVGYLLAWPLGAALTGAWMARGPQSTPGRAALTALIASLVGGLLLIHLCGVVGLVIKAGMSWDKAFWATLSFVPGDVIKAGLCAAVVHTVVRGLPHWALGGRPSAAGRAGD